MVYSDPCAVGYSDKRSSARPEHDAIVYTEGSQVIAENSNGRTVLAGAIDSEDPGSGAESAVMQAAIASKAMPTVYISPGIYRLQNKIIPVKDMHLLGGGLGNTILSPATGYTDAVLIDATERFSMSHLKFDGRYPESFAVGGAYIHPMDALPADLRWQIRFCQFYNMGTSSLFLDQTDEIFVQNCEFVSNRAVSSVPARCADNADVISVAAVYLHFIENMMASDCCVTNGIGLDLMPCGNSWVTGNNFEGYGYGVSGICENPSHMSINNNQFCKLSNSGMYLWNSYVVQICHNKFYWITNYGIKLYNDHNFLIDSNQFVNSNAQKYMKYAFYVDSLCDYLHVTNNIVSNMVSGTATLLDAAGWGAHSIVANNDGYIARGELRRYAGAIGTLTENAFNSVDNPFGQSVALLSLDIYVSTGATATSPNIDCGIGSSATADYTNLFDDLPGETIGIYNSKIATPGAQNQPILWQTGAGNRYLNMSIKDAAATGMVATYVATVMGL